MGVKVAEILLAVALNLAPCYSEHILPCNQTALEPCADNQVCRIVSGSAQCVCIEGYDMVEDECEPASAYSPGDTGATVAVVTIFTLVLIIFGLVLIIRKYNLVEYVRQKINARRNNDVMYEDVMIGNDDPPLSP